MTRSIKVELLVKRRTKDYEQVMHHSYPCNDEIVSMCRIWWWDDKSIELCVRLDDEFLIKAIKSDDFDDMQSADIYKDQVETTDAVVATARSDTMLATMIIERVKKELDRVPPYTVEYVCFDKVVQHKRHPDGTLERSIKYKCGGDK